MRRGSFIQDYIEFEEFLERRDELLKRKKETKKPREPKESFGFFQGLVVAYVAQILYGPATKLLQVYLQSHGVSP